MDAPWREDPRLHSALDRLGYDPFERLEEGTRFQQPAIFICSVLAYEDRGPSEPLAAAGHSLGEYAALVAAGALAFDDALALVDERAAAMADAAALEPGGMVAALGGDEDAVRELAAATGCTVANDNAPGQLVLSGPLDAVERATEGVREAGARARRLPVAGAFHSPLMAPAADRLAAALERTPIAPMRFPVFSCATVAPFTDVRRELAEGLLAPVRWRETLHALRAAGAEDFVERGPGDVLTGLVRRTFREADRSGAAGVR
jgi:malonyl CoA-acyl carrier protein transacylase